MVLVLIRSLSISCLHFYRLAIEKFDNYMYISYLQIYIIFHPLWILINAVLMPAMSFSLSIVVYSFTDLLKRSFITIILCSRKHKLSGLNFNVVLILINAVKGLYQYHAFVQRSNFYMDRYRKKFKCNITAQHSSFSKWSEFWNHILSWVVLITGKFNSKQQSIIRPQFNYKPNG